MLTTQVIDTKNSLLHNYFDWILLSSMLLMSLCLLYL